MQRIVHAPPLALALALAVGSPAGCQAEVQGRDDLPQLTGSPMRIGALLSITGALAAGAPDLERAAILAEEFVNGSTRVFGDDTSAIACRTLGNCGVWVGGRGDQAQRGPLEIIVADTAERPERAVQAAREIADRYDALAFVGPCTNDEVHAVHAQVADTRAIIFTPTATGDSITAIDDRTAEDARQGRPGYVFRAIAPDYVQAEVLAQLAANLDEPPPLVRLEDQTADECTEQCVEEAVCDSYCTARHGGASGMRCLTQIRTGAPERQYYKYSTTRCDGTPPGFCDSLGKFYDCVAAPGPASVNKVCSRYRYRRFCTRVVQPRTALVLYPSTDVGRSRQREVVDYWVKRKSKHLLASIAYDPGKPDTFANVIQRLFVTGEFVLDELKQAGKLARAYELGDSVVFFFGGTTDGTLLLQEWSTQGESLARGVGDVFWLATDSLLNRIFLSHLSFGAVRNLHVVSPYTTDSNNGAFFDELFTARWGRPPSSYAGSVFDSVLALGLAIERAKTLPAASGGAGGGLAASIKDSLPVVTVGCERTTLTQACPSAPPVQTYSPADYAVALKAQGEGGAVRLQGVTGNLSLSPQGDRIGDFGIWGTSGSADSKQFYLLRRYTPQEHGIGLRE